LNAIIQKLAKEMESLKAYISVLETELSASRGPGFDLKALKSKIVSKTEASLRSDLEADVVDSEAEDGQPIDTLTLAEAQYELEKLRGESKAQIQELNEELTNVLKIKKICVKKFQVERE
jgi:hypothetical protein